MFSRRVLFPSLPPPPDVKSEHLINNHQFCTEMTQIPLFYTTLKHQEQLADIISEKAFQKIVSPLSIIFQYNLSFLQRHTVRKVVRTFDTCLIAVASQKALE
ncbi:hypothetical protein SS50377_26100 [Spironucleus salmonicida]|uniref:Uncharacterized protein n=1 Tax=Spironucleus salmonicida TaxID=348837 RepID=V6LU38_9EUKA|nr:hypothetical protein SS50377_26100 [Spironucleus salmonicida]|eukprot:EST48125.1 Hypothetical protein SS50377_11725 [Spironucleus salmonicida]